MIGIDELVGALGCYPGHSELQALLDRVKSQVSAANTEPQIKAYPDIVYHNYPSLGLSFQYAPCTPDTNAAETARQDVRLEAIDVYSGHQDKRWTCFPALPLAVSATRTDAESKPVEASINLDTIGKNLVIHLGEPQRKGGGASDRSGPAAWMEWSLQLNGADTVKRREFKLQIELAGAGARGADRWNAERAGACPWAVLTVS